MKNLPGKIRLSLKRVILIFCGVLLFPAAFLSNGVAENPPDKPNILWVVSEDNSPFLGCYGDDFAITPNLDRLASGGIRYTRAFANAPVCAPARSTIITGCYASSLGTLPMRSYNPIPEMIRFFPEYLRQAGYYCTNNAKEDYNTVWEAGFHCTDCSDNEASQSEGSGYFCKKCVRGYAAWDESSNKASYRNRPDGKPFFHVQNFGVSHESCLHTRVPLEELTHDPAKVKLPPYHPDTPDMRHDWAQYYHKVSEMDAQIGAFLEQLEKDGLAEDTIVFYYADHGGVVGRSKRYIYETGTRIPLIIHFPEKYKHLAPGPAGSAEGRIVSFVDLAPTILSLAGIDIPEYMQGSAFLGPQKTEDPEYAFLFRGRMDERIDMSRVVRDRQFRYIRNYMPWRPALQKLEYLWRAPSMMSWEKAFKAGECNEIQARFFRPRPSEELYDVAADPWEVNNLAEDPKYTGTLDRMRKALDQKMKATRDSGFISEGQLINRSKGSTIYDYLRSEAYLEEEISSAAHLSTSARPGDLDELLGLLKHRESGVRYWGTAGILRLGIHSPEILSAIEPLADDEGMDIRSLTAEILYRAGQKDRALEIIQGVLKQGNVMETVYTMNALDYMDEGARLKEDVYRVFKNNEANPRDYDTRASNMLLLKWEKEAEQAAGL